jgi:predicted O-methyltransferase YrrM
MYKAERKALYNIVKETKPDYCFEIGTYTGGGSTFFLSKALKDNNKGKLFTTENDEFLYNKAKTRYKKYIKSQYSFIEFILSSSPTVFEKYLKENKVNMIFLDGAEDGAQTLEQYNFFRSYFKKGTILALHDWNTEKTIKVKPVILGDNHWIKVTELQQPESIGFAIFRYE